MVSVVVVGIVWYVLVVVGRWLDKKAGGLVVDWVMERDFEKLDVESRNALAASVVAAAGDKPPYKNTERLDPVRAARVLERLASGDSINEIVREEGIGKCALTRMRARHAEALGKRREYLAQDAMELAEKARVLQHEKMDQLLDDPAALKRVNLRDLAMSYGIYADKFHQSTEGNVVTIQHRGGAPSIEDAVRAIMDAKEKLKKASIEVAVHEIKEGNEKK